MFDFPNKNVTRELNSLKEQIKLNTQSIFKLLDRVAELERKSVTPLTNTNKTKKVKNIKDLTTQDARMKVILSKLMLNESMLFECLSRTYVDKNKSGDQSGLNDGSVY